MRKFILLSIAVLLGFANLYARKPKTQQINPRGLFRLQKIFYDDNAPSVKPPFEQYKYCCDSITLQALVTDSKAGHLAFILVNQDKIPLNYTGLKKNSKEIQIFDTTDDSFTLRWYNSSMPNSTLFPFHNYSREAYSKDSIDPYLRDAIETLQMNFNTRDNKMTGVWKRRGISAKANDVNNVYGIDTMYKIYTPNKVMVIYGIRDTKNREQMGCEMVDVKYYDDTTIKEFFQNGNTCTITWIDSSTFTLTYLNHGTPVTEVWDRSGLPWTFQRIFGTNEPVTNKVPDKMINTLQNKTTQNN